MNRQASQKTGLRHCSSFILFLGQTPGAKATQERKGFVCLTFPDHSRSLREARAASQAETQEEYVCGLPHALSQI